MNNKYIFRKSKEKAVSELVSEVSQKYYGMLKTFDDGDMKMLLIGVISEISNNIFDFYIDINRTNNVFYTNINRLSSKLIKEIFILNAIFYLFKMLEITHIEDKQYLIDSIFKGFKFNNKNKKLFYKFYNMYEEDVDMFTLNFVHIFSKKVFSTKKTNRMEFIYIDYYLESSFSSFDKSLLII